MSADTNKNKPSLRKRDLLLTLLGAVLLFLLDAWMLFPGLGLLLAVLMILFNLLALLIRLVRRRHGLDRALYKMIAYGACIVGIYYSYSVHKQNAMENAVPVIHAVQRYHSAHGAYPETVRALVPAYLSEIPTPTWRLNPGTYHLLVLEEGRRAELWWPTHVRVTLNYEFDSGQWRTKVWD